jgi:sarcosine oxidase
LREKALRVIVVGGGIMGLCTAWSLQRGDHHVTLYEQGPIPNPLASSTDQHRLIRYTYGAMTGYARTVRDAHAAWDRLWVDLGRSHYRPTGTLVIAHELDGCVEASVEGLEKERLPYERWTPAELGRRLPFSPTQRSPLCAVHADRRRPVRRTDPRGSCRTAHETRDRPA